MNCLPPFHLNLVRYCPYTLLVSVCYFKSLDICSLLRDKNTYAIFCFHTVQRVFTELGYFYIGISRPCTPYSKTVMLSITSYGHYLMFSLLVSFNTAKLQRIFELCKLIFVNNLNYRTTYYNSKHF